jgi:hypothetical protein
MDVAQFSPRAAAGVPKAKSVASRIVASVTRRTSPFGQHDAFGDGHALLASTVLLFASYAFRLPALLNAQLTNSDAATVGLQAMHLLRGEHSAFLWGSGYQTSADSYVAAACFALLGATPRALMLSALTLHVASTYFAFATLRRRLTPWTALLLVLPYVVSPSSIHSYALYPPRQLSLTLAVAALWAIDAAWFQPRRVKELLAAGGVLFGLGISADPYPMVLAPVVLGYALSVGLARLPKERVVKVTSLALGLALGLLPFGLLHRASQSSSGQMGLSLRVLSHNMDLLVRECLPWALSYKVYFARDVMDYAPWDAPTLVRIVQGLGALGVLGLVALALVGPLLSRMPPEFARLGLASAIGFLATIAGFLVSVMVMDHFSMRYLATLTLLLPFVALPAASRFGKKTLTLLLAPHLVASAISGWVGYGPFVEGVRPVLQHAEIEADDAFFRLMQERGMRYAQADYWASYRLTFASRENVIVVPTNAQEDRYAPHRAAFEHAPRFAYVFDPGRSRERLDDVETTLKRENARVETVHIGRRTVFLVTRRSRLAANGQAHPPTQAQSVHGTLAYGSAVPSGGATVG